MDVAGLGVASGVCGAETTLSLEMGTSGDCRVAWRGPWIRGATALLQQLLVEPAARQQYSPMSQVWSCHAGGGGDGVVLGLVGAK